MLNGFKKLENLVRELGPKDALLYLANTGIYRATGYLLVNRYRLLAQAVPQTPGKLLSRNKQFVIREVSVDDYQSHWFPAPAHVVRNRFEQGAHCIVAFDDGKPVACLWLALDGYFEDEVRCQFLPQPENHSAWDFDVFVQDDYRLSRCFAYLWDYANCWLKERGIKWCMSRINAFNSESYAAHKRLGAEIVGDATFFHLGPVQISSWNSLRTKATRRFIPGINNVAFSTSSTPIIKIPPIPD